MSRITNRAGLPCAALAFAVVVAVFLSGIVECAVASPLSGEVVYVSGSTIYLDRGSSDGLVPGAELVVYREAKRLAIVTVIHTSSGRSACSIPEDSQHIVAGDSFVLQGVLPARMSDLASTEPPVETAPPREWRGRHSRFLRSLGFRGRIGARFSAQDDLTGTGEDYSQPRLDLRLSGDEIAGTGWGAHVDIRARRTYRKLSNGESPETSRTRVYRMSVTRAWPRLGGKLSIGRQTSPSLAAVSVFDGGLAEWRSRRWGGGLFGGSQPDSDDYGYASDVREYGGFIEYQHRAKRRDRLTATAGAIGSYEHGDINREYFFVQIRSTRGPLTTNFTQQVDYNRGWKRDAGEPAVSMTNTYTFLRYAFDPTISLDSGYDNRRAIRLYRHMVTPETEFDDSYRQGYWGRISKKFLSRYRFSSRYRTNSGGSSDGARSIDLSGSTRIPELAGLRIRSRNTVYRNSRVDGRLHSGTLGVRIGRWGDLEGTYGERLEDARSDGDPDRNLHWTSIDVGINLPANCSLTISAEQSSGDDERHRLLHMSTSYRF